LWSSSSQITVFAVIWPSSKSNDSLSSGASSRQSGTVPTIASYSDRVLPVAEVPVMRRKPPLPASSAIVARMPCAPLSASRSM
jgi:hypothetical protein